MKGVTSTHSTYAQMDNYFREYRAEYLANCASEESYATPVSGSLVFSISSLFAALLFCYNDSMYVCHLKLTFIINFDYFKLMRRGIC